MSHSTIDLIGGTEFPSAGTKTPSSSYLVCMVASSRVYTEPNSTTIKTPTTFYLMSSGKLLGIDQPFYLIAHRKPVQLTVLVKIKCMKEGSLMACKALCTFRVKPSLVRLREYCISLNTVSWENFTVKIILRLRPTTKI